MISLAFEEMYSSWKKLTRSKLGGFKLRAPLSLNLHRHLEPHNYTVLENFTDLLIIMSPKFSGNHLPAVPDVQITV